MAEPLTNATAAYARRPPASPNNMIITCHGHDTQPPASRLRVKSGSRFPHMGGSAAEGETDETWRETDLAARKSACRRKAAVRQARVEQRSVIMSSYRPCPKPRLYGAQDRRFEIHRQNAAEIVQRQVKKG